MKKLWLLFVVSLLFVFTPQIEAQTGFSDNFTDSNFTANPVWSGEVSKFEINTAKELQLNNTTAASNNETYLTTTSTVINSASWEFYIRLDFDPSSSNLAKVYLVSDNQDLTAPLNGYYVQIGGQSGSVDNVRLYRQDSTADTLLINGPNSTVASSPAVKIRVTKDAANLWSLFLDQSGLGNTYQLQGIATENKYGTSSYFGVLCDYTSTRSDKFYFDDFVVSGVSFQDTIKPFLSQVSVVNNRKIELRFNEKLDSLSALNLSNYTVNNGIGNPSAAHFTSVDSTVIELEFATAFTNGNQYEVSVQNIEDKAGNTMLLATQNFTYFVPVPANFRDIVINELYPDFTPTNGLPEAEFVELFNASNKVFDLNGWVISDGTSNGVLGSHIFRPGDAIILCNQAAVVNFQPFGTTQGLNSFPTLNNTGDAITLTDNNGNTVDFVNYTDEWYQDLGKKDGGFTLEQINPFTNCSGKNNFIASVAATGGTPGVQNSVFDTLPDRTAPELLSATVVSSNSLLLTFNELLDSNSVKTANYSFNNSNSVSQVLNQAPNYLSVLLILNAPIDSGIIITVSVSNVADCAGNTIASANTAEFIIPALAEYRDIVINELYVDTLPSFGLPRDEFIEIFNVSNKVFELNNWQLLDGSNTVLFENRILKPGEYLILCDKLNESVFSSFGPTLGLTNFPSLSNSGEEILLQDNNGKIIDYVNYDDSWYRDVAKKDGGFTMEQINPFTECSGKNNFIASESAIGGTPGVQNSVFDTLPDLVPPSLLEALVLNDSTLSIRFNEAMDSSSIANGTYTISPSIQVLSARPLEPSFEVATINLTSTLDSGIIYTFSVSGVSDCSGNLITNQNIESIALPATAIANDIVINEILFNSRSGSADFVELFNRSERVISLKNWQIANYDYGDDTIANLKIITSDPILLFPKEYIVLTEDKADIVQQYPLSVGDNILEIADLPSYNDSEGRAYIFNANLDLIDEMKYEDSYHFALLNDDDGVSLERINSEKSSLDETNWHSASEKVGFATPGYKNSQDFTNPRVSGVVSLDPDIISPDGDGFQDILSINYQFNAPGFVANVSIFDRNGRLIKKLVNNELLGGDGTFYWDGITDDNTKARVGIYVVLFEAFNLNGDKEVYKEVITVGSELK